MKASEVKMAMNAMTQTRLSLVLCLGSLVMACGESDLEAQHKRELYDALDGQTVGLGSARPDGGSATEAGSGEVTDAGTDTDSGTGIDAGTGTDSDSETGGSTGSVAGGNVGGVPGNTTDPQPGIDLAGYELVFSDEFRGATVDAGKWKTAYDWGDKHVVLDQKQHYADTLNDTGFSHDPFVFDGETLSIVAQPTTAADVERANGQAWISGVLSSSDRFAATYGYIEARVRVEGISGAWPSITLLADDTGGRLPELYVFEFNGARSGSVFHNYNYRDADGNMRTAGQREVRTGGFANDFHTVAANWTPGEITFYVDGKPTYRVVGEDVAAEDMYLTLSLAVGGVWVDQPSTEVAPISFDIDYIRYWQK